MHTTTLTITITGANDGPVAADDAATDGRGREPASGNVLANDTDVDGGDILTVAVAGPGT